MKVDALALMQVLPVSYAPSEHTGPRSLLMNIKKVNPFRVNPFNWEESNVQQKASSSAAAPAPDAKAGPAPGKMKISFKFGTKKPRATEKMVTLTEQLTAVKSPQALHAMLPTIEAAFKDKSGVTTAQLSALFRALLDVAYRHFCSAIVAPVLELIISFRVQEHTEVSCAPRPSALCSHLRIATQKPPSPHKLDLRMWACQ